MIKNSTSVESAIIGRNTALFKEYLARFAYAMPFVREIFSLYRSYIYNFALDCIR